jgi:predicted Zn-dependent protease with MMP-like domain
MFHITDEQFQELIDEALTKLPQTYVELMKGKVAILWEDDPSPEQREKLKLNANQTLFGLYEGLPLSQRYSGYSKITPDKITIFRNPMLGRCNNIVELKEEIKHTLWHEMAHYFGLDHERISELEK